MIVTEFRHNYAFDPQRVYDFTKYKDLLDGITLYYGIYSEKLVKNTDTNKKVLFFVEWPNCLYGTAFDIYDIYNKFDYIFSICPYTNNYLNAKFNTSKFITTFFPIELKGLPCINNEKNISILYTGHPMVSVPAIKMIYDIIDKTITLGEYNKIIEPMTEKSINGYYNKMQLLANTKIALIHNTLTPLHLIYNTDPLFNDPLAAKHLPWHHGDGEAPQIKSRMFEAAIMKCVLLVYKDKYNLIENYFTEGEDFIYFTSESNAIDIINDILQNYNRYRPIAESAYNKTKLKYTTEAFIHLVHDTINK